ncbi:MAG TPA: tRNA adenosine(34) deaminase TadA [Euzebya sp.]|nr:tRNA adenosine(34) deaminase TadA [Euzebya sp.]
MDHDQLMGLAIAEAVAAVAHGDVPVGAVVALDGLVIASGRNRRQVDADPTAHAEILALRAAAAAIGSWHLDGCELVVTLEPCAMCAGAVVLSRIDRVVYGATDPKAGAVRSLMRIADDPRLNHRADIVTGVREEECSDLLREFFAARRRPGRPPTAG